MKIAYIGIDILFPALESLVLCGNEIVKIFTCKTDNFTEFNTRIIAYAIENYIPYTLERITISDLEQLYLSGCEAVICGGYYYKIPTYNKIPLVNIHPSLLPWGRGSWPMPYEILLEREKGGVTVHKITEGFDKGDILIQKSFAIDTCENHESLMNKVYDAVKAVIPELFSNFSCFYKQAAPQGEGTYLPLPDKSMYTVDYKSNYSMVEKILRAFYGYECFYIDKTGREYMLIRARAVKEIKYTDKDIAMFPIADGYIICDNGNVYN